jgi:hypothetical protein
VTYQDDPRDDLAILSAPRAIIDGVRVRSRCRARQVELAEQLGVKVENERPE